MIAIARQETFLEVEPDIRLTVHRFRLRYGGNMEDLWSIAHEAFMYAFLTFESSCGSFSSYVRYCTWKQMLEQTRSQCRRNSKLPRVPFDNIREPVTKHNHFVTDLLDELSEDGKLVVSLVLDAPMDIYMYLLEHKGPQNPNKVRNALRSFLREVGWNTARITESFNEIREALS